MMAHETIAVTETKIQAKESRRSSFSAVAGDLATMGSGTFLAAIFSTLLVFLIPRLASVEDYGYWRLFLLYAGYVGFLHLGFADGALLRWAGKPLGQFHGELTPSLRFLVYEQLILAVPACIIFACTLRSKLEFVVLATFAFALIMNCVTLLQYSLQGSRQFKPVAVTTAAPVGIFLALVLLLSVRSTPSFRELIALYFVAWLGTLTYLWITVRPAAGGASQSAFRLGWAYTSLGWPIVVANTLYSLVVTADRVVVSSALPIHDFAQYSLAASAMFVPVTAIAAVYRVSFSHLAALQAEGRARVYAHISGLLLLLWSFLLPYYFVLEVFVRRFLPKYLPSLPVAGILLLGAIFLANIQILHMSYFYLHGRQRQFLFQAIGALVSSFSVATAIALCLRSLVAISVGQVVVLGLWWFYNEWKLRETSGQRWKDWMRVLGVFAFSSAIYGAVLLRREHVALRITVYYALVVVVLRLACPDELRFGWKLLRSAAVGQTPVA